MEVPSVLKAFGGHVAVEGFHGMQQMAKEMSARLVAKKILVFYIMSHPMNNVSHEFMRLV